MKNVSDAEISKMLFSRERLQGETSMEEVQLAHELPYAPSDEKRLWDINKSTHMYDFFRIRPMP